LHLALVALKGASASIRYLVCCVALATLALAPIVNGWLLSSGLESIGSEGIGTNQPLLSLIPGSISLVDLDLSVVGSYETLIVRIWGIGVLLLGLRLLLAHARARRACRDAQPAGAVLTTVAASIAGSI
jgi:hypothetical protein